MSRRRKLMMFGLLVLALGVTAGGIAAYQWYFHINPLTGHVQASAERSRRLMGLAAQEAAAITDVDVRLTRLLNLADSQMQSLWKPDGRTTLASAAATLRSPQAAQLNDHARLSGWISISELSRQADDKLAAIAACDGAAKAMLAIEDPARRCEYVMGIANELQYLKGKPAAAALLDQAAPWTPSIDDVSRRRQAVVSFASALFNLDDYPAGQRMLQSETDAAWRSDILTQLSSLAGQGDSRASDTRYKSAERQSLAPVMATNREALDKWVPGQMQSQPYFGRQLGYREVFQSNLKSKTVVDKPVSRPSR